MAGVVIAATPHPTTAQQAQGSSAQPAWRAGFIEHMRRMREFVDNARDAQDTPRRIPRLELHPNEVGELGTYRPAGAIATRDNPFFQDLGSNRRTCFTCHQPQEAWSISAEGARTRFEQSGGRDPLFRLVDGATCPTAKAATRAQRRRAYGLLIDKGLFRVGLPLPATSELEFGVKAVDDPFGCNTDPKTGLTSSTKGVLSVYRRPLPATNLGFLSTIMWDGREPDLASQAVSATLGHAQADVAPTADEVAKIVDFETSIFTAQARANVAGDLRDNNASGGPIPLSRQLSKFFIGVNDPTGETPESKPFTSRIFRLFQPWLQTPGSDDQAAYRRSIARGEQLFNTRPINITGVGGINDPNLPTLSGFCGTCHNTPNVGSLSIPELLNIGVANAGRQAPPAIDISSLPVFTLKCRVGPLAGQIFKVTDPGRALISGKCADIGKFKTPALRALAGRAPYFHNGSATTLMDVVNFYDARFGIGFAEQEKEDLVNFLYSL
jgi:cytochrome c peroxidase